jgi:Cu/Ag efflux pump CusA
VIGGVISSTLLTLLVLPVLYSVVSGSGRKAVAGGDHETSPSGR